MNLKPIKWISPIRCDVLIYDDIGVNLLKHSIPESATVGYLSTRVFFPIILRRQFHVRLFRIILSHLLKPTRNLFLDYLVALIDDIRPRVIITCADNNTPLAKVAELKTDILVIYIQSAIRDTVGGFPKRIRLPNYYAFGDVELELFKTLQVEYNRYIPVGSYKLGVALSGDLNLRSPFADLCFISNHRSEAGPSQFCPLDTRIALIGTTLFKFTCHYASRYGLSLRVLSKSREIHWQDRELAFYKNLADGYSFEFVRGDNQDQEFSTYYGLIGSELIIHTASTLGFESLSIGKKTLFGASMDEQLVKDWGIVSYFAYLPDLVCLQKNDFEHFTFKMDTLRTISNEEYKESVSSTANKIMRRTKSLQHPHEIIRLRLQQHLKHSGPTQFSGSQKQN